MTDTSRSIPKALDVLEILAQAEDGLPLSTVAEMAGYPISTVHRLLASLSRRGYVEQDTQTRRYYLGLKILTLQAQGIRSRHLGRLAFPHLNHLKLQVNETVNLGVLSRTDVVYLETFAPDSSFSFYAPPGTRMPPHCTAMGKLLLAHLPAKTQEDLLSSLVLKSFTPYTITSLPDLRAELVQIVQQGYAVDNQEYAIGVRCLAAPIHDHTNTVVAGVSVTVLAEQLPDERMKPMAVLLVQACLDISHALGYQGNA